ncbi:MAG: DUF427 domain-containing protein [Pseudomonadota bacterium]
MKLPSKDLLLRELAPHRTKWSQTAKPQPEPATLGEESVWDYPRPPEIRPVDFGEGALPCRVEFAGQVIAQSRRVLRVCETAGAPVYYFPPEDIVEQVLQETEDLSYCEWKGAAVYYDLELNGKRAAHAAFAYPDPLDDLGVGFERIAGWVGFYCALTDGCYVGEERVVPQPGNVYAGWVTHHIKGPIKGGHGTGHW